MILYATFVIMHKPHYSKNWAAKLNQLYARVDMNPIGMHGHILFWLAIYQCIRVLNEGLRSKQSSPPNLESMFKMHCVSWKLGRVQCKSILDNLVWG